MPEYSRENGKSKDAYMIARQEGVLNPGYDNYKGPRITFPDLSSKISKQACKYVLQVNISSSILLGITQGIGNVIMATPLIKALASMNLTIDILEGGFNPGAEKVLIDMMDVEIITEEQAKKRIYLLGLQTVWPRVGIEKYCAQVRNAGNILQAWRDGIMAHEVEMNMSLAYTLGYKGEVPSLYCKYNECTNGSSDVKSVGIHICRKYNHQFYANRALHNPGELSYSLFQEGFIPVVIGHKNCVDEGWKKNFHTSTIFLDGKELPETAAIIRNLDCMINEDSGIAHVTAAMNVPQIVIFGPTSDIKNRPWSNKAALIKKNLSCSPCQYTPNQTTCTRNVCMNISPELIIEQVKMLIERFPKNENNKT